MAYKLVKNGCGSLRLLVNPMTKTHGVVWSSGVCLTKTGPYSTTSNAVQPDKNARPPAKPYSDIPGPRELPILGTMLEIPRDTSKTMDFLIQRAQNFFPIYKESVGLLKMVILYDLGEIEKLFRNEAKYPRRFDFIPWVHYRRISGEADGVLTCNDEPWHRMRKVIDKPMLRIKDVSGYADDVNEVVTDFLERLGNIRQADGLVPDLERELFNWSLETIGLILYEKRFGGLSDARDPEMQQFIDAIRAMFIYTDKLFISPPWFSRLFLRSAYTKHNQCWDTLFRVARKCVDDRMNEIAAMSDKDEEVKGGVLSHLLSEKSLCVEEIYSNITELMTGAVDTTSTTMLWMLQELALYPEVQDKLLAEVTSVLPDGDLPTYQDLQKMPYLKAVVKETLRKYPAVPVITRVLQEDMELCGYHVPAKTAVMMNNGVMGRLPQFFDDPDDFKPERWLRGSGDKINPFSLIAFGFGTRMCVGRRVAELEMYMLLSGLIRKFSIEPGFTERSGWRLEMMLKPDRAVKVKLIDRK